jgi:hypothetical protein
MISEYQQQLRDRFLSAPVMEPPDPWRSVFAPQSRALIGGLLGVGFALDPVSGKDLLMVVSSQGHGVFDASTGMKIARDPDPDAEVSTPAGPDLSRAWPARCYPSPHRRPVRRWTARHHR